MSFGEICRKVAQSRITLALAGIAAPLVALLLMCPVENGMARLWVIGPVLLTSLWVWQKKRITWRLLALSGGTSFAASYFVAIFGFFWPFNWLKWPCDHFREGVAFYLLFAPFFHFAFFVASRPADSQWRGFAWNASEILQAMVVYLVIAFFSIIMWLLIWLEGGFYAGVVFFVFVGLMVAPFYLLQLRVLVLWIDWFHAKAPFIGRGIVGLILPVAGLLLNRKIPVPMAFESVWYFVFAFLTGLSLMLPRALSQAVSIRFFLWLLRCFCYPFTLFFFVAFLPMVLIAPLGIFLLGAGLLLIAPTMLTAMHTLALIDDARWLFRRTSPVSFLIPGFFFFILLPLILLIFTDFSMRLFVGA